MVASKLLQQCCGCQVLKMQYPGARLFHHSVYKLNTNNSQPSTSANPSWVRQSTKPRFRLEDKPIPVVKDPHDVVIQVKAASVNPFDVRVSEGYGEKMLTVLKKYRTEGILSLLKGIRPEDKLQVLGRDFSGVVTSVGDKVKSVKPGDEVYGATLPKCEGSHALYTMASDVDLCKKPTNLTHLGATCVPYVALTFLAGFLKTGATSQNMKGKRVHLNAAAGGVGLVAMQYLKAIGCEVVVSVSKDAAEIVSRFNPDHILDYQAPGYKDELKKLAGFDIVYDFAGDESAMFAVKPGGWFLTLVTPLMPTVDEKGLIRGGISAYLQLRRKKAEVKSKYGANYSWVYFTQNHPALEEVTAMLQDGKITPLIVKVFPFEETNEAFEKVAQGLGGGKVVIDMSGSQ